MAKKFSDFGDLSELGGEFAARSSSGRPVPGPAGQKDAMAVQSRTGTENRSGEGRIVPGMKVRMMEIDMCGVIADVGNGWFEIESDGLVFRAERCEFVVVDEEEDRKLRNSSPSRRKNDDTGKRSSGLPSEISVDLHLDKIPGSSRVRPCAALDFQMNCFRRILRQNLKYKGLRIKFIHGVGDGVLASALRKELDEAFARSCTYTFGQPGVTVVTVR